MATAALLGVLAMTVVVHLPINKAVMGWSPGAMPSDWAVARNRWRQWNWGRCVLAVIAFAAMVAT